MHVGSEGSYLALYSRDGVVKRTQEPLDPISGMSHIGVVVDDLDAVEKRVLNASLRTGNHADYDPGRRFYFETPDGIEVEVISYG